MTNVGDGLTLLTLLPFNFKHQVTYVRAGV